MTVKDWLTPRRAAGLLRVTPNALRMRCLRAPVLPSGRRHLGGGIVAYKKGRAWRIVFPSYLVRAGECRRRRAISSVWPLAGRRRDCTWSPRRFPQVAGGELVVVSLVYCEACDQQLGSLPKRRGLSERWLVDFQAKHARCGCGWLDALGWTAIELGTDREIDGDGPITVTRDADRPKVTLINT